MQIQTSSQALIVGVCHCILRRKGLDELKQRRDDVLSHLKETTFSKDFLSSQLKQLKIKQNSAICKEDFELADKINQEIETRQAELRNLKYQHPILDQMVNFILLYLIFKFFCHPRSFNGSIHCW